MNTTAITEIEIAQIRPFISRARPRKPFERLRRSIGTHGIKQPVQVRRLAKPEGRYRYERIVGEGRIQAATELGLKTIPAIIVEADQGELVGRFLTENVLRKNLPWQDKAKLIAAEVKGGANLTALAKRYFITEAHAKKLIGILQQASAKTRGALATLTVEEAGHLTSLPAPGQDIVLETLSEEKIDKRNLEAVVKKAKQIAEETGELSKSALKASLKRVTEDLARARESLKVVRLHAALGPENLKTLLSDKQFRAALDRKKINYARFEEAI